MANIKHTVDREKIVNGLNRIKTRRKRFYYFLPISLAFLVLFFFLFESSVIFYFLIGVLFFILVILGNLVQYSLCPRCHQFFFTKMIMIKNPFSSKCLHCGLEFDYIVYLNTEQYDMKKNEYCKPD